MYLWSNRFQWGLQNNYKQLMLALFWSCLKHQDPCGDPSVASLEECFDWWAFAIVLDIHPREDLMCLMWQDMTRDENVCVAWGLCPNCWVSNISRWGYGQHWSMVPGDHEVWWRVGVVGPTNTVCILCIQCVYPCISQFPINGFQMFPMVSKEQSVYSILGPCHRRSQRNSWLFRFFAPTSNDWPYFPMRKVVKSMCFQSKFFWWYHGALDVFVS